MAWMFVAVGQNGQRLISKDGIEWTDSQTGKEGETWRAVGYGVTPRAIHGEFLNETDMR